MDYEGKKKFIKSAFSLDILFSTCYTYSACTGRKRYIYINREYYKHTV